MACIPSPIITAAQSGSFQDAKNAIAGLASDEANTLLDKAGIGVSLEDVVQIGETVANPQQMLSGVITPFLKDVINTTFQTQQGQFENLFAGSTGISPSEYLPNTLPLDAIEAKVAMEGFKTKLAALDIREQSLSILSDKVDQNLTVLNDGALSSLGLSLTRGQLASLSSDPRQAAEQMLAIRERSQTLVANILKEATNQHVHPSLQDPINRFISNSQANGFEFNDVSSSLEAISTRATETNVILASIKRRIHTLMNLRQITPEQGLELLKSNQAVSSKINGVLAKVTPYRDGLSRVEELVVRAQHTNMEQFARQTISDLKDVAEERIHDAVQGVLEAANIQIACQD